MANGQFQYVLFDWDGCLADTLSIWMGAYVEVFAGYGFHPSRTEIAEKVFGNRLGHRVVGVTDDEGFKTKLASAVDTGLRHAPLHKNVRQVLDELRLRRKKMAVISSSDKAVVEDAMRHSGVHNYFSSVLCSEDVSRHKPDPEGIVKTLLAIKGSKDTSIIIGDGDKDVLAGRNAGIATCLFYPEPNRQIYKEEFLRSLKPDYFMEDINEFLEVL